MIQKLMLPTRLGYSLSVWVEGVTAADTATVVLVHGFGVDKHETAGYFGDLVTALGSHYRVVRFDFGGLGESQGNLLEMTYERQAKELQAVVDYVQTTFGGRILLLAQSMGCFVTSLLSPAGIERMVFTGIPNLHTQMIVDRIAARFRARPRSVVNLDGVSTIHRSSGAIQHIGSAFWQSVLAFQPLVRVSELATKTQLLIIHPNQDDVVGTEDLDAYSDISGVTVKHLDGDHSFSKKADRENVIKVIQEWFEK